MQASEACERQHLVVPWTQLSGILGLSDDSPGYPYSVFADAPEFIAGIRMVLSGVHHGQQDGTGDGEVHISPCDPDKA